jgi:hypothetical protein
MIRSIDWEAGQKAIQLLGLNRSLWIPTWLAGFAFVSKVLQRNKQQDHAECPRCSEFENTGHIILCKAPTAQQQWDASIVNLSNWMTKALTLPDIQQVIISRLKTVRNHTENLPATYCKWPGLNELVRAQDTVGWRNFLEGGILHEWAAKQQENYDWMQKRNTGKRWISTLIKKLWEISWNMWEHRNGKAKNPTSPAAIREHARMDAIITREYQDPSTLAQKDR